MITNLLWRCPMCKTEDALSYKRKMFTPDRFICDACTTVWEFTRTDEEDYYWRISKGEQKGLELRLAEWYRKMKEGFKPQPLKAENLGLLSDEKLYLVSKSNKLKLVTQKTNPLFFSWNKPEFPLEEPGKKHSVYMKSFGAGQLFLTSHRFLWKTKDTIHYFWADKIISIYGEAGLYLDIFYGSTKYKFRIHKESLVKWITYSGSIAEETRIRNDHTILVSNY